MHLRSLISCNRTGIQRYPPPPTPHPHQPSSSSSVCALSLAPLVLLGPALSSMMLLLMFFFISSTTIHSPTYYTKLQSSPTQGSCVNRARICRRVWIISQPTSQPVIQSANKKINQPVRRDSRATTIEYLLLWLVLEEC